MIKIIRGAYGFFNGKFLEKKDSKSEAFEADKAEEARLVSSGVARYETMPDEHADENMSISKLRKAAEERGIDASKMRTKAEIAAAIKDIEEDEFPFIGAEDPQ